VKSNVKKLNMHFFDYLVSKSIIKPIGVWMIYSKGWVRAEPTISVV
jgi:hypothetical protein